uniref:Guanylate cyclase domain-containing protein n=1 Tax=Globodera pallida TaxID=36090 RepID=A0A183CSS2_GLOPA
FSVDAMHSMFTGAEMVAVGPNFASLNIVGTCTDIEKSRITSYNTLSKKERKRLKKQQQKLQKQQQQQLENNNNNFLLSGSTSRAAGQLPSSGGAAGPFPSFTPLSGGAGGGGPFQQQQKQPPHWQSERWSARDALSDDEQRTQRGGRPVPVLPAAASNRRQPFNKFSVDAMHSMFTGAEMVAVGQTLRR